MRWHLKSPKDRRWRYHFGELQEAWQVCGQPQLGFSVSQGAKQTQARSSGKEESRGERESEPQPGGVLTGGKASRAGAQEEETL